jgi:transcriptional regulator with PAS, ATPase and Fis domain
MVSPDWMSEFPAAITICDANGIIVYMNQKSLQTFADQGGAALIGSNLLHCHPEPARSKLHALLTANPPHSNAYTIEKNGLHKLIFQSPWYQQGQFAGLVELSLPIPHPLAHFIRN